MTKEASLWLQRRSFYPSSPRRDTYNHPHVTLREVREEEVLRAVQGSQQTLHARRCRGILRLGEQDGLALNQKESVDLAVKTRRNTHSGELRNVPTKRITSCEELLEKGLVDASRRGAEHGGLQLLEVREKERSHGKEEVDEESEETRAELDH